MKEMKQGKLRSGRSGQKVTNPKQAIAIGLSEARKEGAKVPYKAGTAPKKSGAKKSRARKSAIKKSAPHKPAAKKSTPSKSRARKSAPKKSPAKKTASNRGRSAAKKRGSGRSAGSSAAKRVKTGRRGRSGA